MTEWPNICPYCRGEFAAVKREMHLADGEVIHVRAPNGTEYAFSNQSQMYVAGCYVCKSTGVVMGETSKAIGD